MQHEALCYSHTDSPLSQKDECAGIVGPSECDNFWRCTECQGEDIGQWHPACLSKATAFFYRATPQTSLAGTDGTEKRLHSFLPDTDTKSTQPPVMKSGKADKGRHCFTLGLVRGWMSNMAHTSKTSLRGASAPLRHAMGWMTTQLLGQGILGTLEGRKVIHRRPW